MRPLRLPVVVMATFRSTAQISRRTLSRSARGGPAVRTRIPRTKAPVTECGMKAWA